MKRIHRIAKALGATRVLRVSRRRVSTPIDLLALTDRVRRLRSTGPRGSGRPTNPKATLSRLVKFRPETWRALDRVARDQARRTGRGVSPGQVASMLIEDALRVATIQPHE